MEKRKVRLTIIRWNKHNEIEDMVSLDGLLDETSTFIGTPVIPRRPNQEKGVTYKITNAFHQSSKTASALFLNLNDDFDGSLEDYLDSVKIHN